LIRSVSQSLQYSAAVFAPLIGTQLSDVIGLGGVLWVSAGMRLVGCLLFALWSPNPSRMMAVVEE